MLERQQSTRLGVREFSIGISLVLLAAIAIAAPASAQDRFCGRDDGSYRPLPNIKYDGRFTFVGNGRGAASVRFDQTNEAYKPA